MRLRVIGLVLGHAWALPLSLVGVLVALVSGPSSWRWSDGAIEVTVKRFPLSFGFPIAARTLGAVIAYTERARANVLIQRHERRHVAQCLVLGPLLAVLYPLASLWAWARGGHAYRDNWFEADAREVER